MCKIVTIGNPLVTINPVTEIYNENISEEFTLKGKKYYVEDSFMKVTVDELIDKIIL